MVRHVKSLSFALVCAVLIGACSGSPASPSVFGAPTQLSPADGSTFDHFPRSTTLAWTAVTDAVSYTLEVDCFHWA
jgi:hypothetical protein